MREEIKNAKKTMKKNMEGYKGGEFKALKKKLKDEPWKETLFFCRAAAEDAQDS